MHMPQQTSGKDEESFQSTCSREGLPKRNARSKVLGQDGAWLGQSMPG